MPIVRDFRNYPFQPRRIDRCGKDIGRKLYWKLYALENTIRVVINSVLLLQIGQQWWATAVAPPVRNETRRRRTRAAAAPQHASPGPHDIYLVGLFELTEILRANSHLFLPIIPEANQWLVTLEGIRPSRNLVGHMNFPNAHDRNAIDGAYRQLPNLMARLSAHQIPIEVP
jgi:hypothetical protein